MGWLRIRAGKISRLLVVVWVVIGKDFGRKGGIPLFTRVWKGDDGKVGDRFCEFLTPASTWGLCSTLMIHDVFRVIEYRTMEDCKAAQGKLHDLQLHEHVPTISIVRRRSLS